MIRRYIACIVAVLLSVAVGWSQTVDPAIIPPQSALEKAAVSDSLRVSIVTCNPGGEVYSMFGHTAVRVVDYHSGLDAVFNFGVFNESKSGFIYDFVKGETDYELRAETGQFFFWRYSREGYGVYEQVLNLTKKECTNIMGKLTENVRPENRIYRYNWLYDNCTTRAYQVIASSIEGVLEYDSVFYPKCARELLHDYTRVDSWLSFGIDMLLGEEIDRPLSSVQQMFLPKVLMERMNLVMVKKKENVMYPLVGQMLTVLEPTVARESDESQMPMIVMTLLFLTVMFVSVMDMRKKRRSRWLDMTLMSLQGTVGILIAFLFLFSLHPGCDTNVLVFFLNPLWFIPAFCLLRRGRGEWMKWVVMAVLIVSVMTVLTFGQGLTPAIWMLVFTLLVRNGMNLFIK